MAASKILAELRTAISRPTAKPRISTEIPDLDGLLEGGWRRGTLIEWLSERGSGVCDLVLRAMQPLLSERAVWCIVDSEQTSYPLLSSEVRCLVVRPSNLKEVWWTVEQTLRLPGVAVTWCCIDSVPERVLRRWQLAAEAGGGIGMFFRPLHAAQQRSWSDLRLSVTPIVRSSRMRRTVRVEVVSCRGRLGRQAVMLELHHAPDTVPVVSELDDSTLAPSRARYTLRCAGRVG